MTSTLPRIVVATGNAGKLREFRQALADMPFELVSASDVGVTTWPPEDAPDYAGNAAIKARHVTALTRLPALADDSGIEVDALGGKPGVHSARFGGPGLDDAGRTQLLLERLQGTHKAERTARFRSAIVLTTPDGRAFFFEGHCEGRILDAPDGEGGFGYDPVFYSFELAMGFGSATLEQKRRVSHRGKALDTLRAWFATVPITSVVGSAPDVTSS